jgi:hypothetical protein
VHYLIKSGFDNRCLTAIEEPPDLPANEVSLTRERRNSDDRIRPALARRSTGAAAS